jgi:hypothetical protein
MALPTAYLTSFKNVDGILAAIRSAQAPARFTQKFLEGLGFANSNDRLFINMLKALGMLTETGIPQRRYHEYLDQTQSEAILAQAVREAYADLFQINKKAQDMTAAEVKNKMKTLSEGQFSDRVLTQMAGTFKILAKNADFGAAPPRIVPTPSAELIVPVDAADLQAPPSKPSLSPIETRIGGLVYSINIQLPDSRDQAVYDAIFKALKEHLLK